MIKLKDSVRPRNLVILAAAANVHGALGLAVDLVVTSGNDSQHMVGSKHYTGNALDFRTKLYTALEKQALVRGIRKRLGAAYDVILEGDGTANEHLHVEYDPPPVVASTARRSAARSAAGASSVGQARRRSRARVSRSK